MSIKNLQTRFATVGAIRLGEKRISAGGKEYPAKLPNFRFTSPSQELINEVGRLYGGEPRPWQTDKGPQFEVVSTVVEVPVFVPPQRIDPNLELWGKGLRTRLCDGEIERLRAKPCLCAKGPRGHVHDFEDPRTPGECACGAKRECKPATRVSVELADVFTMGTWKLASHGWNAAAELPMLAAAIAAAREPVPAILRLEKRESNKLKLVGDKEEFEPRSFLVPVLDFGGMFTPRQAYTGELTAAARSALNAPAGQVAISAGPATRPKLTPAETLRLAARVNTIPELQGLWQQAGEDNALTDEVRDALTKRSTALGAKPKVKPQAARPPASADPAPVPAADTEIVDAEIIEDADELRRLWGDIVRLAGPLGWNMDVLARHFQEHTGYDYRDDAKATVASFTAFRDALTVRGDRAGEFPGGPS